METGRQTVCEAGVETAGGSVRVSYLRFLPRGYGEREAWPLLLFLHGAGERGDDLDLVKLHGPPRWLDARPEFPSIVVAPQKPDRGLPWPDDLWPPATLVALLDRVASEVAVDPDRVYVTGLSMGGHDAWQLAAAHPERLAAVVPICGGGDPAWAPRLSGLPIRAFHGALDNVVLPEKSREMVDAVRRAGGDARLTIYEDLDHDAWTRAYEDAELWEWLWRQERIKDEG